MEKKTRAKKATSKKKTETEEPSIVINTPNEPIIKAITLSDKKLDEMSLEELETLLGICQNEISWLANISMDFHDQKYARMNYPAAFKSMDEGLQQVNNKINKINKLITLIHNRITNKVIEIWC